MLGARKKGERGDPVRDSESACRVHIAAVAPVAYLCVCKRSDIISPEKRFNMRVSRVIRTYTRHPRETPRRKYVLSTASARDYRVKSLSKRFRLREQKGSCTFYSIRSLIVYRFSFLTRYSNRNRDFSLRQIYIESSAASILSSIILYEWLN